MRDKQCSVTCDKSYSLDCVDYLEAISRKGSMALIMMALVFV